MRVAATIELNADEEKALKRLALEHHERAAGTPGVHFVVGCAGPGESGHCSAVEDRPCVQVGRWRERYAQGGVFGLSSRTCP